MTDPQSAQDFWDNAPSGHLLARPDGRIIDANATLLHWLGWRRGELNGKLIGELLSVGSRLHYNTHFVPLLHTSGELTGVTVDFVGADGRRLPMFLTANVRTDAAGRPDLVRITALDATDRRAYEREILAQRQRADADKARITQFAETLRRSLLPPVLSPPEGLDAADFYYAASNDDIGGDFYDLFPLSSSRWGFFLGDVAGKGVEAAVLTGLTRYVLRSAAVSDHDPLQVLHNLNEVLDQKRDIPHRLCTLIYGNITKKDNGFDVELASGGHPPPLLLGGDGSAYYADTIGGHAVGMSARPHFVASRMHLAPGDTLVLYTDGLTEASTGKGRERFDDDGALLRFAKHHAPASASSIVAAVSDLLGDLGAGVQDDTALLALGVPPSQSYVTAQIHLEPRRLDHWVVNGRV